MQDAGHDISIPSATASFASPEYFRMLHHSLPGPTGSSGPPSPRRRLTQPIGFGQTTSAARSSAAEFIISSPADTPASYGISSAAFSPNYFGRFFVEERELGRGGKGVVLLVKHILDGVSLGHFALKRIPVGDDHEWLKKVLVEVQLLQHLSHQNLVSYRHVWLENVTLSNFGPSVPCAFVLQQYCNGGDLHNYIYKFAKPAMSTTELLKERMRRRSKHQAEPPQNLDGPRKLSFDEIYSFFKDITSGLNHLHANNYIHRDLKPSNCLLHDSGKELRVLVSDFGEVQPVDATRCSTGATGTISYCAPEVLQRDHLSGSYGNFTTKSDIFSLGMILYFLCFAQLPYGNADNLNEENEDVDLLRDEIASWAGLEDQRTTRLDLPDKLYRFLRRLLSLDPMHRPTTEEILQGIKTGSGLEEAVKPRPQSAGQPFDDSRTSSRISSFDTASATNTPIPPPPGLKTATGFSHMGTPPKLRLNSSERNHPSSPPSTNTDATSPGGSLVLRPRHSPPREPPDLPRLMPSPNRLPPPHRAWYHPRPDSLRTLKVMFFLIKIISIYLPCIPVAAKPTTALLLLVLATLDLLFDDWGLYASTVLMAGHAVVLAGSARLGALCVPKGSIWEAM